MNLKNGAIAFTFLALGAFATGCGSACDDLEDEYNSCCERAPAGTSCSLTISGDADDDACQALLDSYTCPF